MTTSKKPAFVQLRANRTICHHPTPAQHRDEVEFFSIYLGEPGDYQWVADFDCNTAALNAAHHMVMAFGCEFDRSQFDMVMDTSIQEVTPQPKGHPHAALMAEYAKDAAETDKPWKRWEAEVGVGWTALGGHPYWERTTQYRRKPEPPKTIMVNGFEVPAPLDMLPDPGDIVWAPNPLGLDFAGRIAYTDVTAKYKFERGLLHTNRAAAVAHAKAMLGIDPTK